MLDLKTIFDPDRTTHATAPVPIITPADLPSEWHLHWDERAAIMEAAGKLPRERADALALIDTIQAMKRNAL